MITICVQFSNPQLHANCSVTDATTPKCCYIELATVECYHTSVFVLVNTFNSSTCLVLEVSGIGAALLSIK